MDRVGHCAVKALPVLPPLFRSPNDGCIRIRIIPSRGEPFIRMLQAKPASEEVRNKKRPCHFVIANQRSRQQILRLMEGRLRAHSRRTAALYDSRLLDEMKDVESKLPMPLRIMGEGSRGRFRSH